MARCISVGSDMNSSLGVVLVASPVSLPASGPVVGRRFRRTLDMSERSGAGRKGKGRNDLSFGKNERVYAA